MKRGVCNVAAIALAGASLIIGIAWVASYFQPVMITRAVASRLSSPGIYAASSQTLFSSAGGVHLWNDSTTHKRIVYERTTIHIAVGNSLMRTYPKFDRNRNDVGFAHGGVGVWIYSFRDGPEYMFVYNGPSPPSLDEMQRNPETWGTLIWLTRHVYGMILPYWLLMLVIAPYPAVWLARFPRRLRSARWLRNGRCSNCGYDLRATPDRCPECGSSVATAPARQTSLTK